MELLAISFVWDIIDQEKVEKYVKYTTNLLTINNDNPFSRNINLPIFYYHNSNNCDVPPKIKLDAEYVLVYIFISMNTVVKDNWNDYIQYINTKKNYKIIPIALDETAFNMENVKLVNYIRLYEYKSYKYEQFFISFAHEIYRIVFSTKISSISKSKALKIFISHAKDGKVGLNVACQLKKLIDSTSMSRFFDTTDIAPGYVFSSEIIDNIKESSIIIVNSDIYSSRYWCQREIQISKENDRPMIEVDLIEKGIDRKYPYASNLPVVRANVLNDTVQEKDLYRILEMVLIETIRCNYADKKLLRIENLLEDHQIKRMCRPPELFDLQKLIEVKNGNLHKKYNTVLYPDPPIYSEELQFFKTIGIDIYTPITMKLNYILKKKIGISISNPRKDNLVNIGQNEEYIKQLSQTLARYLLGNGATLIYGGDLRPDGFTENLIMEAKILNSRLKEQKIKLINYISWPIYLKDTKATTMWMANYKDVLLMKKVCFPEKIENSIDTNKFIESNNLENSYIWSCCLTKMREEMIQETDIRIFAGGSAKNYKGKMPGILEELLISIKKKTPIYLLGGFGGIVSDICKCIENEDVPEVLTMEWQIINNNNYKELMELYKKKGEEIDYLKIVKEIKNIKMNNGLNIEDNRKLYNTVYIDEAIYLVLKGLKNIWRRK